jgi:high-affinity iron transporter
VFEAFLIMLREGFEATLLVAIVLAYLRRIERPDLTASVWGGVVGGIAVSIVIGLAVRFTLGGLEGEARLVAFACISAAAAAVLTWMIFWMRRQSRHISNDLHRRVDTAVTSAHAGRGVIVVAFAAVLREGIEAALFLIAASVSASAGAVMSGGIAGLLAAALLGAFVYLGGRTIPLRTFFRVTGVVLIIFAAGLVAKAVFFLQAAGDLGTLNDAVYNLTGLHWLTISSESGRVLAGLFGWDPRPSLEQVVAWVAYTVPVLTWFLAGDRLRARVRVLAER